MEITTSYECVTVTTQKKEFENLEKSISTGAVVGRIEAIAHLYLRFVGTPYVSLEFINYQVEPDCVRSVFKLISPDKFSGLTAEEKRRIRNYRNYQENKEELIEKQREYNEKNRVRMNKEKQKRRSERRAAIARPEDGLEQRERQRIMVLLCELLNCT